MNSGSYSPEIKQVMKLFDADEISPNRTAEPMFAAEGGSDDIAYTAGGVAGTKSQLAEWKEQGGVMAGGRRSRRTHHKRRRGHKKSAKRTRRSRRRM